MSYLFVFEGVDGVGKTTLIRKIANKLEEAGITVRIMSDPSKEIPVCAAIRQEVLDNSYSREQSSLLFQASRVILDRYIRQGDSNEVILLDRYWPSTAVYQYDGVDLKKYKEITELMHSALQPDAFFLIEDTPERIQGRLAGRDDKNRYDDVEVIKIKHKMRRYRDVFNAYKGFFSCVPVYALKLQDAQTMALRAITMILAEKIN